VRDVIRRLAQGLLAVAALALVAFAVYCDEAWCDKHVFLPQQFFIAASRGIVFWSRAFAAATAFVLMLLVPRVPQGASARRLLIAALLSVPAADVLLQWRMGRLFRPELVAAMDALTTADPRYGVTFAPSIDRVQPLSGREIRFRTDAERRRISGTPIDRAAPSLVFTGESAVAGFGLQWEETFPVLVSARLNLQVVNLASPNYRADQSWLRLRDALPGLDHPVAVVGIFMPGLVGRSFASQRRSHGSGLYRLWKHLYWSDAEIQEGVASVGSTLAGMDALAKTRGAPCVFVVMGHTPPWMMHDVFEVRGLDAVVVDIPPSELLADGHPGPRASIRIADALEARLRTRIAAR